MGQIYSPRSQSVVEPGFIRSLGDRKYQDSARNGFKSNKFSQLDESKGMMESQIVKVKVVDYNYNYNSSQDLLENKGNSSLLAPGAGSTKD